MRRLILGAAALALAGPAVAFVCVSSGGLSLPPHAGRTFYIDYAGGSDASDGLSPTTAFKHAPGDPTATGGPAAITLHAGDMVAFKGGVPYLGEIDVNWSGSGGAPIIYEGTGWGTGKAIISGLANYSLNFTDLGGGLAIADLTTVSAPAINQGTLVYIDGVKQYPSAYPALGSSGTPVDHIDDVTISFAWSELGASSPTITGDSAVATVMAGIDPSRYPDLYVRVYESGNTNHQGAVTSYTSSVLTWSDPTYLRPPSGDTTCCHVHFFNSRAFIASFGQFAFESGGTKLVAKVSPGVHTVALSSRHQGIVASGKSYWTADGFEILGIADRGGDYHAAGIWSDTGGAYITVTNNNVHDTINISGTWAGIAIVGSPDHLNVSHNVVGPLIGHGMGVQGATNSDVSDNHILSTTSSALVTNQLQHSRVRRNRIDDITQAPGAHADAMEIYDLSSDPSGGWSDIEFSNNQVESGAVMVKGGFFWSTPATLTGGMRFFNNVFRGSLAFNGYSLYMSAAAATGDPSTWTPNVYGNIVGFFGYQYTTNSTLNGIVKNNIFLGEGVPHSGGNSPDGRFDPIVSWNFHDNTWGEPWTATETWAGGYAIGDTYDASLYATVNTALATPGPLPDAICRVVNPGGTPTTIGLDYTCGL